MIAIVDYGVGNLFSLSSSVRSLGAEVRVTRDAADLRAADHILLPGVGAFADAMAKLEATGLVPVLREETQKKPLLGICRGIQVLNVAMGGTVHQHLPAAGYENHSLSMFRRGEISHTVRIQPESRLGALLGTELGVNSFHHQAVDRVAEGFVPVASAPDGVIEAIEPAKGERFVLGVQWHPEMMALQRPEQLALLKAFTAACTR